MRHLIEGQENCLNQYYAPVLFVNTTILVPWYIFCGKMMVPFSFFFSF